MGAGSVLSHVRVADAPLLTPARRQSSAAPQKPAIEAHAGRKAASGREWVYMGLLAFSLVHFTLYLHIDEIPLLIKLLVLTRYLLWPCILAGFVAHLARSGSKVVFGGLAPFSLFLLTGILSGAIGPIPSYAFRAVVFWLLGVVAACTVAAEIPGARLYRCLFVLFVIMLVSSAVFALADPTLGAMSDGRLGSARDWRGLFPGKNLLGLIAVYAMLFTLVAPAIRLPFRGVGLLLAAVTLVFAKSQGALLVSVLLVLFLVGMPILRRQSWPPEVKTIVLIVLMVVATAAMLIGFETILALLGRDASLTGRSDVWPAWLARASENWPTGTGPASFTVAESPVTRDLTAIFSTYGAIHTPHNMFIAVFGEVGIFGLVSFTLPLFYMMTVVPFRYPGWLGLCTGAIAFTMVLGGISETREVFGQGMNMFLLLLSYTALLADRHAGAADASGGAAECAAPGSSLRALA